MTAVDRSDNNDGITFEHGSRRRVRAVVMRYGQRLTSDWRKNKGAALRNLVVKLTHKISQQENANYSWESGEVFWNQPDDLRLVIAEGLEAMAARKLGEAGMSAELFHLNGKRYTANQMDRLYRGAWTLRWVHNRESAR
jgi:hypothetical protein